MPSLGIAEFIIVLIIAVIFWGIPIAAGIWAMTTLHRIHADQKRLESRLEEIARALQNQSPQ